MIWKSFEREDKSFKLTNLCFNVIKKSKKLLQKLFNNVRSIKRQIFFYNCLQKQKVWKRKNLKATIF